MSASRASKTPARKRTAAPPGRRWPLRVALFGMGLLIGCLLPWAAYLDRHASDRFLERQWKQAGRVYARPLELFPGKSFAAEDFEQELAAAGVIPLEPLLAGRYRREGARFTVALPARAFADGVEAARTFRVGFDSGRIQRLTDVNGGELDLLRLPPAELGSLLPQDERDRTLVAIDDFPALLVTGVQAVEDRQFRHHHGVDPRAVVRALLRNLRSGDIVQGGSTITQQLVKNLFLDARQTLTRKFNEAIMAISLEARFSKAEILEAYLNEVFLGQRGKRAIHGFGRASEHYFGLPVDALSSDQIALLIGMVRGASWYHPERNPERALARRNLVLEVFRDTGLISDAEFRAASARPLGVDTQWRPSRRGHPAFMELVARQLQADYRDADLREKGLRIYTTLSPSAQRHAEQALARGLEDVEGEPGALQGAVVLAQPGSGEIRALVGDRRFRRAGFNRALDARRPIGSVIKPFVYLLALADPKRYALTTLLEDAPLSIPQRGRETWRPRNYTGVSHGPVPLITALANSYNQATVALGMQIGVEPLFRLLEQLGVAPGSARHPAAFLGAIDLSPLQVAQLYQSLASGGYSAPLRAITEVVDNRGKTIARYPMRLRPIRERAPLALLDFALRETVRTGTARGLTARLRSSAARSAEIRGKTGTTSDRRDAWFAGYTDDWLGVVWVGRDDNQPAEVSGAASALPIWARLFDQLPHPPHAPRWPDELAWYWIDWPRPQLADEGCPGARALPFIEGSQPAEYSECLQR